jgi:DNA-binding MarR family transcriptional regulator
MTMARAQRRELVAEAIAGYWKSLAMVDPLRIEAWDDARVTMPLLRVLVYLREHPGAATGDIARRMSVTSSNVTRLVDRLVEQGFVRREADPDDRRYLRHLLTADGEAVLGSVQQKATAFVAHIFEELSDDDLSRLTEVFGRLWDAAKRTRRAAERPVAAGARR